MGATVSDDFGLAQVAFATVYRCRSRRSPHDTNQFFDVPNAKHPPRRPSVLSAKANWSAIVVRWDTCDIGGGILGLVRDHRLRKKMSGLPLMAWIFIAVVVGGILSVVVSRTINGRRAAKLPDVAEERFIALMSQRSPASPEAILRERAYLAKAIGIPVQKLHPESRLQDIVGVYPGFQKQIAMNDLRDDLFGLAKDTTGR